MATIEVISATRYSAEEFWSKSALGLSLRRLSVESRITARIAMDNKRGLPDVYNENLAAAANDSVVVLLHDDVWIDDLFFYQRVIEGLRTFDVIGVAGNRRRVPQQPAWAFVNSQMTWDDRVNLSGAVAHGQYPFGTISYFGETPAECELLDGVFLAARKSVLTDKEVFFDPRFDFHFYDMDFCRSARQRGLRLGTWPICLTHQSGGAFGGEQWQKRYRAYLDKWEKGTPCPPQR
jgi:GT2 family glycosyltransferase